MGPIFHRGRLDGSARVLIIGQDPATHETICRRILVGEAGQRTQGLLAVGITRSYVLINAFLYSVYGQGGGSRHIDNEAIAAHRNRWLDTLATRNELQAIISLGQLADQAYQMWKATPAGAACTAAYATIRHPTYPESASRAGSITKAEAFAKRVVEHRLTALQPLVTPDEPHRSISTVRRSSPTTSPSSRRRTCRPDSRRGCARSTRLPASARMLNASGRTSQ